MAMELPKWLLTEIGIWVKTELRKLCGTPGPETTAIVYAASNSRRLFSQLVFEGKLEENDICKNIVRLILEADKAKYLKTSEEGR